MGDVYRCVTLVVLTLLITANVVCEPASLALYGDDGHIEWQDSGGGYVASLTRNGSAVEVDAPLHTQDVRVGNVSLLAALTERLEIIADLSAEVDVLHSTLAELQQDAQEAAPASTWTVNDNWIDLALVADELRGYYGGCLFGGFAYIAPYERDAVAHGQVVRIDTSDFSSSGVEWFDLAAVNTSLVGFRGAFAAGEFVYYVPNQNGDGIHGFVVRVNVSDFSESGVSYFNLAIVDPGLKGYDQGFAAGEFAYYVPVGDDVGVPHGRLVRINMSDFSPSGVEVLDLATASNDLVGLRGGVAVGDFAYFSEYVSADGYAVRVNMSNFTSSGVEWFSLAAVDSALEGFSGICAEGEFVYYSPLFASGAFHGHVVRVNTLNFSENSVEWFDVTKTANVGLSGFALVFVGQGFVYYPPYADASGHHGRVMRIDVSNFAPSGVEWMDLALTVNTGLAGFVGGFASQDFAYLVPFEDDVGDHGRVVRIPI